MYITFIAIFKYKLFLLFNKISSENIFLNFDKFAKMKNLSLIICLGLCLILSGNFFSTYKIDVSPKLVLKSIQLYKSPTDDGSTMLQLSSCYKPCFLYKYWNLSSYKLLLCKLLSIFIYIYITILIFCGLITESKKLFGNYQLTVTIEKNKPKLTWKFISIITISWI